MTAIPAAVQLPDDRRLTSLALRTARLAVPVVLLVLLVNRLGFEPFRLAGRVLAPAPILAALVLGLVATTSQAMRWRSVALGLGAGQDLTRRRAVQEYYRAAFLNVALPGGLAGDAVRVWRRRTDAGRPVLRPSAAAVITDRVLGAAVLFLAAGVTSLTLDRRLAATLLAVAGAASVLAVPGCRRMPPRAVGVILGWSVLAVVALLAMATMGMDRTGVGADQANQVDQTAARQVVALALVLLAATSVPLGVVGFGPREAVAALVFASAGLPAAAGVAAAGAFGLLAVVSVLPGAVVVLVGVLRPDPRPPDTPPPDTPPPDTLPPGGVPPVRRR